MNLTKLMSTIGTSQGTDKDATQERGRPKTVGMLSVSLPLTHFVFHPLDYLAQIKDLKPLPQVLEVRQKGSRDERQRRPNELHVFHKESALNREGDTPTYCAKPYS
jgi:hypothetical protein